MQRRECDGCVWWWEKREWLRIKKKTVHDDVVIFICLEKTYLKHSVYLIITNIFIFRKTSSLFLSCTSTVKNAVRPRCLMLPMCAVFCLCTAASVRHCLSDAVQHQLHVAAHPPLQPGRAARHHRNAEEGPFPLQVGLRHIQTYVPNTYTILSMQCLDIRVSPKLQTVKSSSSVLLKKKGYLSQVWTGGLQLTLAR